MSQVIVVAGASYAFFEYSVRSWLRRRRVEHYLRRQRDAGEDEGQRTVLHLMRNLRMTEAQVEHAAYTSSRIDPRVTTDPTTGLAREILFEYRDEP